MTKIGVDVLLVLTVFSSWFLFPVMLKLLAYAEFQFVFLVISTFALVMLLRYSELNQLEWSTWHKWFVSFWAVYLLFLLGASIHSGELYSLKQYCIVLYKVVFFAVLLIYMKENFIVWSFRLYAALSVLLVLLASLVSIGLAVEIVNPIQSMTEKVAVQGYEFSVYWGAYYNKHWSLAALSPYIRMQGFSEEPGTFALAILPAFYWLLAVEKAHVYALIVMVGLFASYSTGALLGLILLMPLLWEKNFISNRVMLILIVSMALFGFVKYYSLIHAVFVGDFLMLQDKLNYIIAMQGRLESLIVPYEYLLVHPFGTGNALGMMTVNTPISVGYANAMLESGVIGGIAYCAMFGLLAWKALKLSLAVDIDQNAGRIHFVVAITVLIVLFMGLQRQQPDLSLWHMWIYACFFYLTMEKKSELTTEINGVKVNSI